MLIKNPGAILKKVIIFFASILLIISFKVVYSGQNNIDIPEINQQGISDPENLKGEWLIQYGDDAEWESIIFPSIEGSILKNYFGPYKLKKEFNLNLQGIQCVAGNKSLIAILGKIDDDDQVYFNGIKVGENSGKARDGSPLSFYYLERYYFIPGEIVKEKGKNTIIIKSNNYDGEYGISGDHIGIVSASYFFKGYFYKFHKMFNLDQLVYFIVIGILMAQFFWYAFNFIFVRERNQDLLLSIIFVLSSAWLIFQLPAKYIFIDDFLLAFKINNIFVTLNVIFIVHFFQKFLEMRSKAYFYFIQTVNAAAFLLLIFISDPSVVRTIMTFWTPLLIITFIYYFIQILASKKNYILKAIIGTGSAVFFLSAIYNIFAFFNILNFLGKDLLVYGFTGFVFSLIILQSYRYIGIKLELKWSNKQLAELNNQLEQKVEERTEELRAANEEMKAMNESLVETRDALWGEMQLARMIQTVLLPKNPVINGYEICGHMEPADEVGGDYYDIINAAGIDWAVIGDVSGHGVPAGLIMMMVQTAIHACIRQNPGTSPSNLLATINSTIYENIELLGENKYMTITVMTGFKDGKVIHSGLHQDVYIYRGETGTVDTVQTSGMWIGLLPDIDEFLTDDTLTIGAGDTMLLYTDGITEARGIAPGSSGKSAKGGMYGDDKLIKTFRNSGKKPIGEIKTDILASLEGYDLHDDVTFVVVKRVG